MTGFRPISYGLALLTVLAAASRSAGQQPPAAEAVAPEIQGVLADSQRVLDRLKLALDLTTPAEKKQYETLKEYVEVFLFGVDRGKPVRMDVLTGRDDTTYRLYVPVEDFRDFWKQNLDPLGIPVQQYQKRPGEFKLGGGKNDSFFGDMLYDANKREGYAIIWERPAGQKQAVLPPAEAQVPIEPVRDLLTAGYDAALRLRNKQEGVDVRRDHYSKNREEILAKLKRDSDESVSDFNLRRSFAGIQFDETARIYAEAKEFLANLTVSPKPEQADLKFRIDPLPDTSLAESVAIIGQTSSRFAGVPVGEDSAATGRINFPLDEFRKKNAREFSQQIRANELEKMAAAKDATPEQKEAGKQFINTFLDLGNAGIEMGVIDGFLEMSKEDGGIYTIVGGLKVPDGAAWIPLMELLPKTRRATDLKTRTGEYNGVTLHEITLTKDEYPDFFELLGSGRLLAGTGPDTIWYAAGPKAEEALKRSIDQAAAAGEPNPVFLSFRGELLPAVRILDHRLGSSGQDKYRDMAIQAFEGGEGRLNMNLTRNGDAVDGEMTIDRGFLRLLGKGLADFSKENLQ